MTRHRSHSNVWTCTGSAGRHGISPNDEPVVIKDVAIWMIVTIYMYYVCENKYPILSYIYTNLIFVLVSRLEVTVIVVAEGQRCALFRGKFFHRRRHPRACRYWCSTIRNKKDRWDSGKPRRLHKPLL